MTTSKRNRSKALVLSPADPLKSARRFISSHYTEENFRTVHHHRGSFYAYTGSDYREIEDQEVRSYLYDFLEQAKRVNGKGRLVPFEPNQWKVSEVVDALKAEAFLRSDIEMPVWLDDSNLCSPHQLLACSNGLLHLPTQILIEHTPAFFGYGSLPFEHNPEAPAPAKWHNFLGQLWPDDPASIRTLREWFGYCLSPDTRQQKILLIVGPKRSGKGTIGRIQRRLLGAANVCAPTLPASPRTSGSRPLSESIWPSSPTLASGSELTSPRWRSVCSPYQVRMH